MARSSCGTCMMVTGTIMGPIVMVFLAVSFATDFWLDINVQRSKLSTTTQAATDLPTSRYTHTRNRGLFRECYPGTDNDFLVTYESQTTDGHCFHVKYEIPDRSENDGNSWTSDYEARIHLMRCHLALFILALVSFLAAYVFGLVLCCWRQSKWAYAAGLCAYIAAFSTAAAIAFFHGAEYLEKNKISDKDPNLGYFAHRWPQDVDAATESKYGYSYILGWVGMVLAALTATFYSIAGCYIGGERYEDKEFLEKDRRSQQYVDRSYPMQLEPAYPEYYYGYTHPAHGIKGPVLYDMESRRPLPAIQYATADPRYPDAGQYVWQ